jgi:predicted dehydrogenase/threonine dehydrogenase-like Zn-dependent dehydrogenase
MKQVLVRGGAAVVEQVPAPGVEPGTVLVRVDHSCISIGTELQGVRTTGLPLWERALRQPQNVKRVWEMATTEGFARTRSTVRAKLAAAVPVGYSAAGVVLEVGAGLDGFRVGDRVACAGAQYSHHAEVIRVPANLAVRIPDGVGFPAASTVALGAIAMQGVRRLDPTLGETFVVIGLGALGQLTAQMLAANGCQVIGADLDPARVRQACENGMPMSIDPGCGDGAEQVRRMGGGAGADGVVVTAATSSAELLSTAFQMCRRKGRVVLVGDVGLNIDRNDIYVKELDFLISTSYGPGRYDDRYEEEGLDYPVAYVRWTENRNMEAYLRLIADGRVSVDALLPKVYPVDEAPAAYRELDDGETKPLMVLLSYPSGGGASPEARTIRTPSARPARSGRVRIAVVGAGSFARAVHLPNLQQLSAEYELRAVVSRTGHNASAIATQFGAGYASTDYDAVLADVDVDAVLLATRHDLHASMTLEALRAGKHVLVEKPLALSRDEMAEIEAFFDEPAAGGTHPLLLTGFNRRFSSHARHLRDLLAGRTHPLIATYRMNAGYIPPHHWTHLAAGGGRNVGEACHIYDLFTFLTGSPLREVSAQTIAPRNGHYTHRDNFTASIAFADGSLATLTYTAMGDRAHPKEQMEVFCEGRVLVMDDFRRTSAGGKDVHTSRVQQKGHLEELQSFASALCGGGEWPIPLWQQFQAMEIAFQVEDRIRGLRGGEVGAEADGSAASRGSR